MTERLHTLYRFYDESGVLLYVGITADPSRRFEKHRGDKTWWRHVARIDMAQYGTRDELRAAERVAIENEAPLHNIRMNRPPRGRPCVPDGLVGRWFHSYRDDDTPEARRSYRPEKLHWQGRVVEEVTPAVFLVQTYSWFDGMPHSQKVVPVEAMAGWTFYDTAEEMQLALGCSEYFMSQESADRGNAGLLGECRAAATHRTSMGNYVCSDHARYYSDAERIR